MNSDINYKIYIISIKRNKTRQESLLKNLLDEGFDKNKIEIFIGIDYKEEKNLNLITSTWGYLTPKSVIACASSHILLWNHVSQQKLDFVLILEDDSYVIKNEFEKYLQDFKTLTTKNNFINLSKALRIPFSKNNNLFVKSELVLALDTYIISPNLAKTLFEYYKKNKISYHIDLHLALIKNQIPMTILHFNKNITISNMKYDSTMVENHNKKFFLRMIRNTDTYKDINTPFAEIDSFIFNAYRCIIFFIFIFLLTWTFLTIDKNNNYDFKKIICMILWFILGLLIYDCF